MQFANQRIFKLNLLKYMDTYDKKKHTMNQKFARQIIFQEILDLFRFFISEYFFSHSFSAKMAILTGMSSLIWMVFCPD